MISSWLLDDQIRSLVRLCFLNLAFLIWNFQTLFFKMINWFTTLNTLIIISILCKYVFIFLAYLFSNRFHDKNERGIAGNMAQVLGLLIIFDRLRNHWILVREALRVVSIQFGVFAIDQRGFNIPIVLTVYFLIWKSIIELMLLFLLLILAICGIALLLRYYWQLE